MLDQSSEKCGTLNRESNLFIHICVYMYVHILMYAYINIFIDAHISVYTRE